MQAPCILRAPLQKHSPREKRREERERSVLRETRQLTELKTAPPGAEPISFPADLSSVERKYVHAQAQQMGLKSQSTGKGAERYIQIFQIATDEAGQAGEAAGKASGLVLR